MCNRGHRPSTPIHFLSIPQPMLCKLLLTTPALQLDLEWPEITIILFLCQNLVIHSATSNWRGLELKWEVISQSLTKSITSMQHLGTIRHHFPRFKGVLWPLLPRSMLPHPLVNSHPFTHCITSRYICHPQYEMHSISSTSHHSQSICLTLMQNARGCSEVVREPKNEPNSIGAPCFSRRYLGASWHHNPADSTEFFRRETPHCTEFVTDRFVRVGFWGILIRAATTCQWFTLNCIGSSATLLVFPDRPRDNSAPLTLARMAVPSTIGLANQKPALLAINPVEGEQRHLPPVRDTHPVNLSWIGSTPSWPHCRPLFSCRTINQHQTFSMRQPLLPTSPQSVHSPGADTHILFVNRMPYLAYIVTFDNPSAAFSSQVFV